MGNLLIERKDSRMAVTKEALQEVAEKLFKDMDTNNNGKLEKNEVKSFTMETMKVLKPGQPFNEEEFEENFANLDKNQDGSVSKQELFDSLYKKAADSGALAEGNWDLAHGQHQYLP